MTEGKPPMLVELKITFDGVNTQVSGPVQNELLCQAILEAAAQAIRDHNLKLKMGTAAKSALIAPKGLDPRDLHLA